MILKSFSMQNVVVLALWFKMQLYLIFSVQSSSGTGVDGLGTRPPLYPSHFTKSKSDAKIYYSATDIPSSVSNQDLPGLQDAQDMEDCPDLQDICPSQNVPDVKLGLDKISAPRADIVMPRSSLRSPKTEEPDVQAWTESQGSYSPERLPSNDQLSSTISQVNKSKI